MSKYLEQWNNVAEMYFNNQEISDFAKKNREIVKSRFYNLKDKTILDLGCGYGWYTNYFSKVGGKVIGCDGSENMLSIAKNKYPDFIFEKVDIEKELPYEDNYFDIVFCNQVLMDIKNIENLISEIYRITKQNGIFYMSVVHPAFYDCIWKKDENGFMKNKVMERYLSEYSFENNFWGKTTHFHRTISLYFNTIINCGFTLIRIEEPKAYDNISKSDEFPLFLFAEFSKK